jgi:hypothetical protein
MIIKHLSSIQRKSRRIQRESRRIQRESRRIHRTSLQPIRRIPQQAPSTPVRQFRI